MKNSLSVRAARPADLKTIIEILDQSDLRYSHETLNGFQLAEKDGLIAGIVRLDEQQDFIFLTSLGVRPEFQKQGIATALLEQLFKSIKKPIYLYTIIPDFFSRLGFVPSPVPPSLPPKKIFGCDECFPDRCCCMVKLNGDPPLS
mgnify:CR=1 FL=1